MSTGADYDELIRDWDIERTNFSMITGDNCLPALALLIGAGAMLAGRVPENTLLSHDLLEAVYARASPVTAPDLVDDYTGRYLAYSARQHRWARGD